MYDGKAACVFQVGGWSATSQWSDAPLVAATGDVVLVAESGLDYASL